MEFLKSFRNLLLFCTLSLWACQPSGSSSGTGDSTAQQQESPDTFNMPAKDTVKILEDYENTNRVVWQMPQVVIDLLGNL